MRPKRVRSSLAVLLASVAGLLGCFPDAPPPLRSPADGGPSWATIESPHFTMHTDVPVDVAKLTLTDFEVEHGLLASVLAGPEGTPGQKINIVLFERGSDYFTLTGVVDTVGAFFSGRLTGDLEDAPTLVLRRGQSFSPEARRTFLHELTHRFLRRRSARLPRWLNEGLADYYSTVRDAGSKVLLGEPVPTRGFSSSDDLPAWWKTYDVARETGLVPLRAAPTLRALLTAGPEKFMALTHAEPTDDDRGLQAALYAASYRLVHLLRNHLGDPGRFDAFVAAVEGGTPAEKAFVAAYGDPASPRLEATYREYLTHEDLRAVEVPFTAPRGVPTSTARPMTSGEVLDLWARLRPWTPATVEAVRRDLDRAVVLDRASPETLYRRALFALHDRRIEDARRDLDAALGRAPRDPRYLLARAVMGRQASQGGPGDPALLSVYAALAQAAASPAQLDEVAWALAMLGKHADGLPFVERALAADPTCAGCEDTRAVLLFALGRRTEALAAMDRAIALLPDGRPSRLYLLRRFVMAHAAPVEAADAGATVLSPEGIAAALGLHAERLRTCRLPHPVTVQAVIGPEGSVRAAWSAPGVPADAAVACALRVIRGAVFPPFAGPAAQRTFQVGGG
jgi:hypothetical protein